ncbi:MAG: hypothetical protein OEV48_01270 [Acidobacteriota bacterium]|nr:hypothetical protein [Acidobacteriota bacterium]
MSNDKQAAESKGLPVWAWVGIGCGALMIVVLVVVMVGGFFVARKVKDVAADFEDNPAMATARMIVKLNPELEEISTDEDAGTITVRNTRTGEEMTVNFEDIEEGKFSFSTDDGEITVDASELQESGTINVTDDEGGVVFSTGGAVSDDVEAWVPIFPGCEPTNRHSMRSEQEQTGGFELETPASVEEALEFYRAALTDEGYEVSVNTFTQEESEGGMVNGTHREKGRNVVAIFSSDAGAPTKIVISYSQR